MTSAPTGSYAISMHCSTTDGYKGVAVPFFPSTSCVKIEHGRMPYRPKFASYCVKILHGARSLMQCSAEVASAIDQYLVHECVRS